MVTRSRKNDDRLVLMQGTLDVLILRTLLFGPEHGQGVARALIDAIADDARARGCAAFYWLTKADNEAARTLYDKVARNKGFIRYDYPL